MILFSGEDNQGNLVQYKNFFEYYGRKSRCVVGNIRLGSKTAQGAFCLKYTCSEDLKEIYFNLDNKTIATCSEPGRNITLPAPFKGYLECPDPEISCKIEICKNYFLKVFTFKKAKLEAA